MSGIGPDTVFAAGYAVRRKSIRTDDEGGVRRPCPLMRYHALRIVYRISGVQSKSSLLGFGGYLRAVTLAGRAAAWGSPGPEESANKTISGVVFTRRYVR